MITKLKIILINHLLNQNDWMQSKLKPYSGMIIQLEIDALLLKFAVDNKGQLSANSSEISPDACIQMTIKSLIELITQKKRNGITVKGNLGHVIGDIPATEITKISKRLLKDTKNNIRNLAENFIEYWQEENKILSKKHDLDIFNGHVDELAEDVDRVEAKINNYIKDLSR